MPSFGDAANSAAPPEEVWKLLYDPACFPDWWAGVETVEKTGDGEYTMYPDGYPDFPMAQLLDSAHDEGRVTVSAWCRISGSSGGSCPTATARRSAWMSRSRTPRRTAWILSAR